MPRTLEPDQYDLESIPPPSPVFHVEQALLGALLLEPQRLGQGLLEGSVGSPEHWGERVLQRSVLATARHIGMRIEAFTDNPAGPTSVTTGGT
ncbi:hypothetical protein [Streptomyces sp. NPDC001876]|uniref:hypothetical protein n=1 Tax=Streptomyces sp. NPDC001876 TaxID=3154402 RepID=UPI003320725B